MKRWGLGLLSWIAAASLAAPARALEQVVLELPNLNSTFTLSISELRNPEALMAGDSDLAELDRAASGAIGRSIAALTRHSVPVALTNLTEDSIGSPLLEQALLVVSSLGQVEGQTVDLSGERFKEALAAAAKRSGGEQPTLLDVLEAIPGQRVRVNLAEAAAMLRRMLEQRRQADRLFASAPPSAAPTTEADLAGSSSRTLQLPVAHRPEPLEVVLVQPTGPSNQRVVLISHGLWDTPTNFQAWGRALASKGYTVALPRHPGSDNRQQRMVLSGKAAPPKPAELALRVRDLSAITDALAAQRFPGVGAVKTDQVVVIGHSWGATTALQQAGLKPMAASLRQRCDSTTDPQRNLSWTLQCSWLDGVGQADLSDPRVVAAAAVSPPMSLLFSLKEVQSNPGRLLVVSGTHDWVVPPDPEALAPMRQAAALGHQVVLAKGGDHFNLRPGSHPHGGVLAALLVRWVDAVYGAGSAVRPAPGAPGLLRQGDWGHASIPLRDVSSQL
ncbi:alpha/beta hydrolase family protein [Vulcanococcus sp.]|jgi:predicted dienelactone hydrolase|uniref:alpha/beta hydrolase family protein n=1 Tax=Vulcanococcus sp. TaxID=2856995 RepID=UPI00323F3594